MLKSFFIFINIIGFFLLGLYNNGEIVISHKACELDTCEIPQGKQKEVRIVINKDDLSGPGRLKLDLTNASGIQLSEMENDGASFTFKNNEGLFIWYDLPKNKNIEITYLIYADESSSGIKQITGNFSYISGNNRISHEIDTLTISVIKSIDDNIDTLIKTQRTIEGYNGEYTVKIHALKGKHKGFARIKDELPEGYIATPLESAGAIFKNIDGSAKFIWSDLPSSIESFTVSYKLVNPSGKDTSFSISGVYASEKLINIGLNSGIEIPTSNYNPESSELSYNKLINDTSEQIKNEEISMINKNDSNNIELDSNINKNMNIESKDVNNEITLIETELEKEDSLTNEHTNIENEDILDKNEIVQKNDEQAENNEVDEVYISENIISTTKVNSRINYKVQILASHRIASESYIANQFHFKEKYDLENHQGWIKYTTGTYDEYENARNKRNELDTHEFPGPFVTAYNFGQRITVQEALIVSKQNWVQ